MMDSKPKTHPDRAVILLSGGMDSATLLFDLANRGVNVFAVGVYYGQRHKKELNCATELAGILRVGYMMIDIDRAIFKASDSCITGDAAVPHGHYADATMRRTVVPHRNALMLVTIAALAAANGIKDIYYAAHSGDHAIYPDCRNDFIRAMAQALALGSYEQTCLHAPYAGIDKAGIVKIGTQLQVPYQHTWSCYEGGDVHCGNCGTCVERREAFAAAKVKDPVTMRRHNK